MDASGFAISSATCQPADQQLSTEFSIRLKLMQGNSLSDSYLKTSISLIFIILIVRSCGLSTVFTF